MQWGGGGIKSGNGADFSKGVWVTRRWWGCEIRGLGGIWEEGSLGSVSACGNACQIHERMGSVHLALVSQSSYTYGVIVPPCSAVRATLQPHSGLYHS